MPDEKKPSTVSRFLASALDVVVDGVRAFAGFRVVALGESGVGKTTLWRYLESGGLAAVDEVEKTLRASLVGQDGKFKVRDVKLARVRVRVKAIDVPGDAHLRESWGRTITGVMPQGVIFMIDHAAPGEAVGAAGFSASRMNQHREAWKNFSAIVTSNADVQKRLRAVAILVNKTDVWGGTTNYGQLLIESGITEGFAELRESKIAVYSRNTSAKFGENVQPSIEWLAKNMAARK